MSQYASLAILLLMTISCVFAKPITDEELEGFRMLFNPPNSNDDTYLVPIEESPRIRNEIIKKMKKIATVKSGDDIEKRNFGHGRVQGYLAQMRERNGHNVNAWNQKFHSMFGR